MSPTTVGTTIARGGQTAHAMSQESAAQPSAVDVWTHSYDGMSQNMQAVAENPASLLSVDTAQLARAQAAAMNLSSASANQIENSMSAQASALGESVTAIGQADGALQTVGATFAMLTGAEQLLSTLLSAIPFPSLPAVRILDFDIGLPHAHSHPPNLIPPAPPIPLPSIGPVIPIPILSGATSVLVNGMPAGRCGDMGLGIWCGGYFPMYEVFLGSSNVWIEGARAARSLVDITKHCLFTIPKPSDPPLGPMIGTTISASFNVLIGGFPMPSLTAIALGGGDERRFQARGQRREGVCKSHCAVATAHGQCIQRSGQFCPMPYFACGAEMIVEPMQLIMTTAFGKASAGLPVDAIAAAEARLSLALPEALKDYFTVVGNSAEMMDTDFHLLGPDKLRLDGPYLVFCEENQSTAQWGINRDMLAQFPNPRVEGRATHANKWFSESSKLSAFLLAIGAWQAIHALPEKACCELPEKKLTEKIEPLLEYIGEKKLRSGALRIGLLDRANSIVASYLYSAEMLYVGSPVEGAIQALEKRSGLEFDSL